MSQEQLNSVTHEVLYDEHSKPLIINDQIYLWNVIDDIIEIYDMSEEIKSMFNFVSTTPDTSGCKKQLASSVKTHTSVLSSASPSVTSTPKSCASLSSNTDAYSRASYQLTPGTSGCKKQLVSSVKSHTSVSSSASPSVTSTPKSCTSLSLNTNAYSRASYQLTPGTSGCKKQLASSVKTHTSTVDTSDNFENDEMYDSYEFLDPNDFTLSSDIPPAVSHPIKRKKTMKNVNENDSMNNARAVWSRDSSLNLIFWYKQNISNFNSPKIRNVVAWQMIVDQMENDGFFYTVNQCKRHFYELKSKYLEKNDNMSHKSSGAAPINFEFFEEFKDMFHDKPNINPKHRASSLHGTTSILHPGKDDLEPLERKRKKSAVDRMLEMKKISQDSRERRHNQRMALQEEALEHIKCSRKLMEKALQRRNLQD